MPRLPLCVPYFFFGLIFAAAACCAMPPAAAAPFFPAAADSAKPRRLGVLPVPTFGYAPETRWYVGAVSLFTYNPYQDSATRTSNAELELSFTQNRQIVISTEYSLFTRADRFFVTGDASYNKFPENFWGIGNHTLNEAEELYDSRRIDFRTSVLRQLRPRFYLGPRYQLQRMYGIKAVAGGLLAAGTVPGAGGSFVSGLGYSVAYDLRDNVLNPQRGPYLAFSQTFFTPAFGSDHTFTRYDLDLRTYFQLPRKQLLALQATGLFNSGRPPFRMLALLGSETEMRGYYRGRFRDRQYLAAQAEYRVPLFWRLGAAAWGGYGQVAPNLHALDLWQLKPTYGLGLRFLIDRQENVNLRIDAAFGQRTTGFYVSFGEAF